MKQYRWQIGFGVGLIMLSAFLYGLHFLLFRDMRHILIYLLGDIAFLPADVLLVTLVIHELLALREKRARHHKFNIMAGIFFSEVGTPLITLCCRAEKDSEAHHKSLKDIDAWANKDFDRIQKRYASQALTVSCTTEDLALFRDLLANHLDFLLRLLENPILIEHESFTDLLWAVFHLADELRHRTDLANTSANDLLHLNSDIMRAYQLLIVEWLGYMKHLKNKYPYLFSLAVRTSPFNPDIQPEIQ